MNPVVLFLLAIISPFLLFVTLVAPMYGGILGASYIIYSGHAKVHPLQDKLLDVFYIIEVYAKLFNDWTAHMASRDFFMYTLPLLALPMAGIFIALWLTHKLSRRLKRIFHYGADFS